MMGRNVRTIPGQALTKGVKRRRQVTNDVKSCMTMLPVTMGPMPRCMSVPDWPAKMARKLENRSSWLDETPKSGMLERAK